MPSQYGKRKDGTQKGLGFFGPIKGDDGSDITELSIGVDFGKGDVEIPTVVPTLTGDEVAHIKRTGATNSTISEKAIQFAIQRMKSNSSFFATPEEEGEFSIGVGEKAGIAKPRRKYGR